MKTNISLKIRIASFLLMLALWTCPGAASAGDMPHKSLRAVLAPLDDTNWPHLADSLGLSIIWFEAPVDSSALDSMYYECLSEVRRSGVLIGFWRLFDSDESVSVQYQTLRQFAVKDSTDMIPLLVLPDGYDPDSLQRCLDSCRIGFGQSPALCLASDQALPKQFERYHSVRTLVYYPQLMASAGKPVAHIEHLKTTDHRGLDRRVRELALTADMRDNLRHYYPRLRYFTDSVSVPDMIDVSHWQGKIDWQKVYDAGIRYAYIKLSQSTDLLDDCALQNVRAARAAGIKVGVYHFFSTKFSAREQFRWFCRNYKESSMDLRPMIDVESNAGKLGQAAMQDSVRMFMNLCEKKFGYRPVLYTYQTFYNRWLASAFWQETLFLALYREDRAPVTDGKGNAAIWQYSSKGRIRGIQGNVDLSKFHRDLDVRSLMLPSRVNEPLVPPAARDLMLQKKQLEAPEPADTGQKVALRPDSLSR